MELRTGEYGERSDLLFFCMGRNAPVKKQIKDLTGSVTVSGREFETILTYAFFGRFAFASGQKSMYNTGMLA